MFVAAHGNSIRAIVKMIEGISDDVIPGLEIPTGALMAASGLTGAAWFVDLWTVLSCELV